MLEESNLKPPTHTKTAINSNAFLTNPKSLPNLVLTKNSPGMKPPSPKPSPSFQLPLLSTLKVCDFETGVSHPFSDEGFPYYKAGVYNTTTCSEPPPNHGIAVVGYGVTKDGDQYYILKNSWGVNWGMQVSHTTPFPSIITLYSLLQGYMLLARNAGNMCGIASQGTYVIV